MDISGHYSDVLVDDLFTKIWLWKLNYIRQLWTWAQTHFHDPLIHLPPQSFQLDSFYFFFFCCLKHHCWTHSLPVRFTEIQFKYSWKENLCSRDCFLRNRRTQETSLERRRSQKSRKVILREPSKWKVKTICENKNKKGKRLKKKR